MRKWMLYISACVISVSLFLGFLLQLSYRNPLFESNIEKYGQGLVSKTIFSIQEELDQEFKTIFTKINRVLTSSKVSAAVFNSVLDDIAKESTFVRVISMKNKELPGMNFCQENFIPTAHSNIYELCKMFKNIPIHLYLDFDILKTRINDIYKIYQNKFSYTPIKVIFYQKHVLYLNLKKESVKEHRPFIFEAQKLIKAHKKFTMRLDGSSVFILPVNLKTIDIKDFFVFLGIAPYKLPFTVFMWFTLISVFLLCLIFFLLLIFWINNMFNGTVLIPIEHKEFSPKTPKHYPELKNFVNIVKAQEEKYESNQKEQVLNETKEKYFKLMQEFSLVENTIILNSDGKQIKAKSYHKSGTETLFDIDSKQFFFPTILGKNQQSFYIYRGAGNTTPVKVFLKDSNINLEEMEGFVLIILKKDWSEFIVHTINKEVNHDFVVDLYEKTRQQFLK